MDGSKEPSSCCDLSSHTEAVIALCKVLYRALLFGELEIWTQRPWSCFEDLLPNLLKSQPVVTEVGGRKNIILKSLQIFWLTPNNFMWYNRRNLTRFKFLISKAKAVWVWASEPIDPSDIGFQDLAGELLSLAWVKTNFWKQLRREFLKLPRTRSLLRAMFLMPV